MPFSHRYNVDTAKGVYYAAAGLLYTLGAGMIAFWSWKLIDNLLGDTIVGILSGFLLNLFLHPITLWIYWIIVVISPIFMFLGTTRWQFSSIEIGRNKLSLEMWSFQFEKDGKKREPRIMIQDDSIAVYYENSLEKKLNNVQDILSERQLQHFISVAENTGYLVSDGQETRPQRQQRPNPVTQSIKTNTLFSNAEKEEFQSYTNNLVTQCAFCNDQQHVEGSYCWRCALPLMQEDKFLRLPKGWKRVCPGCDNVLSSSQCSNCDITISMDNEPDLSTSLNIMMGSKDPFQNRQTTRTMITTMFNHGDQRIYQMFPPLRGKSKLGELLTLTNLIFPVFPSYGDYNSRREMKHKVVDLLSGLVDEFNFSKENIWIERFTRATCFHHDLVTGYYHNMYSKLVAYRNGLYNSEDYKTSDLFAGLVKPERTPLTEDDVKNMTKLYYGFTLSIAERIMGHHSIADEIDDLGIKALASLTDRLVVKLNEYENDSAQFGVNLDLPNTQNLEVDQISHAEGLAIYFILGCIMWLLKAR